jgi:hypothetical protein
VTVPAGTATVHANSQGDGMSERESSKRIEALESSKPESKPREKPDVIKALGSTAIKGAQKK